MAMILRLAGEKKPGTNRFKGMRSRTLSLSLFLFVGFATTTYAASDSMVDPNWKSYTRVSGISGNVNSIGSDTLNNLMTLWAEGFRRQYPNVKIQIEGKGSSTAPPALIAGTAQLAPMSRKMKSEEIDAFVEKYGYEPTPIGVALDSLAVYVNKDNPIEELSLQQVDAIFSKTRSIPPSENSGAGGSFSHNTGGRWRK